MPTKKPFLKIQCQECKRVNYYTRKSKGKTGKEEKKLEMKKYCRWCHKHTVHKEARK